ncbi:glycosyltransferase [Desulforamulus hydrothermalis]|nr:glycosyltransferase [Desulforamulus hydrothermalis]SHG77945.1 Tetratricopeptide repeat-containing protein [Desulforamulus hydrothermalis Lam5 = DSM 18033]
MQKHPVNSADSLADGLSLCMIVRNEEKNLPKCIHSVKNLVDEIILVDTGSRDRTIEIGRNLGAKVFSLPWTGDFARARNFSLVQATKTWILVLDADETLRSHEHSLIKELISGNLPCEGFYLKLVNYFSNYPDDYTIDAVCRLFKNKPQYRFSGSVHESIAPSIINYQGNSCIRPVEVHIDHRGYLNQSLLKQKSARNINILDLEAANNPTDAYNLYAMGTELFQQGNYEDALTQFRQTLSLSAGSNVTADVYFKMAVCCLELAQYQQGLKILKQGQNIFPDFTGLWYLQGMLEFRQGNYQQAARIWQQTLDMGDPPWHRYTFPYGIGTYLSL